MPNVRSRARAQLPSVLLTLLSIIQAVALERLWDVAAQRSDLFDLSLNAALAWLQIGNTFFVIVVVWLVYLGLVMRYRWTPTIGDLTYPFVVGVAELSLIETMSFSNLGAWFIAYAAIFAILQWLAHDLYRRARDDPENSDSFRTMGRATWRDHCRRALVSLAAAAVGVILWRSEGQEWMALIALTLSAVLTLAYVWLLARFWDSSMSSAAETVGVEPPADH